MPKYIPPCPPIPTDLRCGRTSRKYHIRLITPMFGGGAEAGKPDPDFPIRSTAIRGQLRHWWRLTVGCHMTVSEMWQREEEVFGSVEFPSPLNVRVLGSPLIEQFDPNDVDRFGPIAYALFPAIESGNLVVKEGINFRLELSWADEHGLKRQRRAQNERRRKERKALLPDIIHPIENDIKTAFAAWTTFGGIGARTRRGCGTVHVIEPASGSLPEIDARIFVGSVMPTPMDAWEHAVREYREFRQSPRGRRHDKRLPNGRTGRVPGRTHWPEPDSIRQITGSSLKPTPGASPGGIPPDENPFDHSTPVVPTPLLPSFPRALLGLPINFHFSDGPGRNRPGTPNRDPQDVVLYPLIRGETGEWSKAERMASPVITRPLWLDGQWHPAIIILNNRLPTDFKAILEGDRAMASGKDVSHEIQSSQISGPNLGALRPMHGESSAIEAFVKYLDALKWRLL